MNDTAKDTERDDNRETNTQLIKLMMIMTLYFEGLQAGD